MNDFYIPNISLCETNCEYEDFNVETLKANCACNVKNEIISDTKKAKFSPNKIIENFYKLEKYTNIRVVICYNQVFNKERLKKNWGSYITIFVSFFFILLMILNFVTLKTKILKIIQKLILEINLLMKELKKKEKEKEDKNIKKIKPNFKEKDMKYNIKSHLIYSEENIDSKKSIKNSLNKKGIKIIKKKNKISNPKKKSDKNNVFIFNTKIILNKKETKNNKYDSINKNKKKNKLRPIINTNKNSNKNILNINKNNKKKNINISNLSLKSTSKNLNEKKDMNYLKK